MYNAKPTIAYALRNDATLLALIPESQMFDGVAVWPGEVKYPYLVYSELANVEGLQADDGEVETEVTFRIYLYSKTSLSTIYQNIDRIMGIELDFERNYARDNDEMLGTEIIIRSKIMSYTNTFINDLSGAPVYPDVTFVDGDEIDFIAYTALSADPSDPADGESVTWLSDGTESGNAGDLMMKITVGAITRTKTVVEF